MKLVKLAPLAAAALCVLCAAGCDNSSDSGTPTSTLLSSSPTVPLQTENIAGTVQPGSNDSHNFTVQTSNFQIAITLTTAGPPATIQEGLGVGQVVAGTCQLLSGAAGTFSASTTPQLSGTIAAGTYCLLVYDVGNQTGPITYTAVVQHY